MTKVFRTIPGETVEYRDYDDSFEEVRAWSYGQSVFVSQNDTDHDGEQINCLIHLSLKQAAELYEFLGHIVQNKQNTAEPEV